MEKRGGTALFLPIFLALFVFAVASPLPAAEDGTIIANKVRLRAEPAAFGKTLATLDKGERVECLFVAGFSETVDGHAGSWCAVARGGETGFVFSRYVRLDSGAVPVIEGPAYEPARDRLLYFAETIRRLFGTTETDVRARMGEPESVWEGGWGKCEGVKIKVLRYPDAEVELFYPTKECDFLDEREFVDAVEIKSAAYRVLGLGVGSPFSDVIEALGHGYDDLAMRADFWDLRYADGAYPQYIIDFIYEMSVTGDAETGRTVTGIGFQYNVLGD
jgi:hypothetical protein